MIVILTALALIAASGLPSVGAARRARLAARVGLVLTLAGAGLGMAQAIRILAGASVVPTTPVPLPVGTMHLSLDGLGAFFLVPVLLNAAMGTLYGMAYWSPEKHRRSSAKVRVLYGWLAAAMGLVVLAADGITFIAAYEIMSLCAFGLVTAEDQRRPVRQAGWLYLVATHISILLLMAFFALWRAGTGSFALVAGGAPMGAGMRVALFLIAVVAFGCKAGMMPLHFWLPDAHASAPSHVSALLSGVVIKMGVYGLLRIVLLLAPGMPVAWGALVLLLGTASAVLGVAFALAQHDLKRLLAYHSVENIGIILMGIGIAMIGLASHHPAWAALGLAGGLLHVWNHALFKPLLFLSAGSVIHHARTRQIDRMGGLARAIPFTAGGFLLGAVAICGLPPLNGFVSEWLVYMGLLHGLAMPHYVSVSLGAAALALVGALAAACFVKAYGTVFLGEPRTGRAHGAAHESPAMLAAMGTLAACCVAIGLFPWLGVSAVRLAVQQATATDAGTVGAALAPAAALNLWIAVTAATALVAIAGGMSWARRRAVARRVGTWDCGYLAPTARMEYTASSFAATLIDLMRWILRPHASLAPTLTASAPPPPATPVEDARLFPGKSRFHTHVGDLVLDGMLMPAWSGIKALLVERRSRRQGSIQFYLIYICATAVLLLLSILPWDGLWQWLLAQGR